MSTVQKQCFSVYVLDLSSRWRAALAAGGEMGCTPSKSAVVYSQDKVCRDLDTCSTFVPSLKSSVSTPEKPRLSAESSRARQTFLSGEFMVRLLVRLPASHTWDVVDYGTFRIRFKIHTFSRFHIRCEKTLRGNR